MLAGTPLIGCTAREAMIDELRIERAGLRKALTPFEQLTMREREVLAALVDGLSAEEIAETQYVALTTVRSQIRSVLQKLGVRSQLAAVAHANRVGWEPEPRPAVRRLISRRRAGARAGRGGNQFVALDVAALQVTASGGGEPGTCRGAPGGCRPCTGRRDPSPAATR